MNIFTEQNIILMAVVMAIFTVGYFIKYLVDRRNEKKRRGPWI